MRFLVAQGMGGVFPSVQVEDNMIVVRHDRISTDIDTEYLAQFEYPLFDSTSSMLIIDTGLRIVTA
jgi:hypothetical protein